MKNKKFEKTEKNERKRKTKEKTRDAPARWGDIERES